METLIDSIKNGKDTAENSKYNLSEEFDINDLKKDYSKKEEIRTQLYNKLLLKCVQTIQYKHKCGYFKCTYEIPTIGYGIPICNKRECIQYLMYKLKKKGFKCYYLGNNIFEISWESIKKEPKFVKKTYLGI